MKRGRTNGSKLHVGPNIDAVADSDQPGEAERRYAANHLIRYGDVIQLASGTTLNCPYGRTH